MLEIGEMKRARHILGLLVFSVIGVAVATACDDSAGQLAAPLEEDDPHGEMTADEHAGGEAPNADPTPEPADEPDPADEPEEAPDASAPDAGPAKPPAPKRVDSPVPGKSVTYRYGVKSSRYAAGYHTGEDYAAPAGHDVVAVRSGKIVWSNDKGGAYGKWMGLEADNGRTYVYCHLSKRLLSVGAEVVAGQVIGKVGATGNVTGPHLHFEDHPKGPFVYGKDRKPSW